jgi:hypothetical protein
VIGGRILDPSALAAFVEGNLVVESWLTIAPRLGMTIWTPTLARIEVETLYPRTAPPLMQLLDSHPQVLFADPAPGDLQPMLDWMANEGAFDATAVICAYYSDAREWPILTSDRARLARLHPEVRTEEI